MIKKQLLLAVLLAGTIIPAMAQQKDQPVDPKKQREKMQSMKIAYISTRLELTPQEAEKFWPIYNEYVQKNMDLRKKMMPEDGKNAGIPPEQMSEEQAQKRVEDELAFREQHLALMKEYTTKFETAISAKKVAKLYQAEKEFRMHRAGHRHPQKKGGGPPGK